MLNDLLRLLQRFKSDERGAFLVIFGVMAIVLVATSGAVVDFTSIEQARTRAQVALDSAALGLQPRIYDKPAPTEEQLRVLAENLLRERMEANDITWGICAASGASTLPCVRVESAEADTVEGSLVLDASIELPMAFVSLVGVDSMRARLLSEATRKRLNIEVAMVLDNSGSMSSSNRMGHLKAAANCAVNVLLKGACSPGAADPDIDNVKIGIVPFTEFVNVGTASRTAAWMDGGGVSDIANDNFDTDDNPKTPFNGPLNRFALYDNIGVPWAGCVEARKSPHDTEDTVPNRSDPDTLFVPAMAPDEPDYGSNFTNSYLSDTPAACPAARTCTWTETRTGCSSQYSCSSTTNTYSNTPAPSTGTYCVADLTKVYDQTQCTRNCNWWSSNRTYVRTRYYTDPRAMQERQCKYAKGVTVDRRAEGPNGDCPESDILPLTSDRPPLINKISTMVAKGGTNIHQGVMWGFHMLSPTEPLSDGVNPYDSATSKVMIVMTDGENTYYPYDNMNGAWLYMPYGFPYNQRLGKIGDTTAMFQAEMDARTATTCENAKAAGISIYTIGLATDETSDPAKVKAMLTNCASSTGQAYFPHQPSELTDVFVKIASELANLRLAR
jgi:Mg-chelatase subunit ChlD/Flp pilus assembly pilin Flp